MASVSGGNPSLTVRNDQIGVVGRSIDDIIAYDKALLANDAAHATAEAYVAGLSNSDIKIGKKVEAVAILKAASISFVEQMYACHP